MSGLSVVILAAGKGTRMKSRWPKVLQPLAGQPLLGHVLARAAALQAARTIVIYGHGGDAVQAAFAGQSIDWVEQAEQLGTGHAVQMALPVLPATGQTLILYGDVPLISADSLRRLQQAAASGLAMITLHLDDPTGYGRIVREQGRIVGIVEQKDADEAQKRIREVNTGIYCVDNVLLHRLLPRISNQNAQGEYYLTDLVGLCAAESIAIGSIEPAQDFEVEGVNDRLQLAALERRYQRHQVEQLMRQGVHLMDPDRFDLRGTLQAGQDVRIDVNVIIEGDCVLGDGVVIGAHSILRNCRIGAGTKIRPFSYLDESTVGENASVGPYARLRTGTELGDDVHVGNFVETKNTRIGAGSKAGHLTYLGDAVIGRDCNIGAGTITCNYDGANKHQTTIDDRVFVGSNSSLVAPVHLHDGVTTGAGSVITKPVPAGELAVGRARQLNLGHYTRPVKTNKK